MAARRGATDRPPVPSEGIETRTERDEAANDGEEANADADENEGVDENEDVGEDEGADANAKNGETVIDPVCGMDVVTDEAPRRSTSTARPTTSVDRDAPTRSKTTPNASAWRSDFDERTSGR
ncbi:hypothetical protein A4G99_14210 [Haladaptatus sp. R4]|nr:hypothetical protein A4G99_14210 [Haladaptatus sp. R4]